VGFLENIPATFLPPPKRLVTLSTAGWVGPRADLGEWENLFSTWLRTPNRPARTK